jgi:tetratricopeptide (TPR) repeat protein
MNMRTLLIAFICSIVSVTVHRAHAQADKMLVNLGNEMYSYGDVEDAFDVYEQAIGMNPNNVMAYYMSGRCLLGTSSRKGESVEFFKKAYELDPEVSSKIFWYIGQGYHFNYQFDEARNYYLLFKEELETNRRLFLNDNVGALKASVERKIYECENAKEYLMAIKKVTITNLGEQVNSEADDYAPTLSLDESRLIFTSRRQGSTGDYKDVDNHYFEDIWVTDKTGEDWGEATNMGE